MAQAVQTRCRGCGEFIAPRPELDDWAAEERAYHQDRYQEHDCQAEYTGYSLAPRPDEYDAWLASADAVAYVDPEPVEMDRWPVGASRPPVTVVELPPDQRAVSLGGPVAAAPGPERPIRARTIPAPPAAGGWQLNLGGNGDGPARPGRERDPGRVRLAPYLDAPAGWWDTARPGPPADGGRGPAASRPGRRVAGPAGHRPRRRGLRLSRLLRWLQDDDPRLTGRLEQTAQVVEWVERLFVADP